jgi:hypothetical protein
MARLIGSKALKPAVPVVGTRVIGAALLSVLLGSAGMALAQTAQPPQPQQETTQIRCLLPAEIERYGTQLTIVGARQVIETSRAECAERSGEVVDEGASPREAEPSAQPQGAIR